MLQKIKISIALAVSALLFSPSTSHSFNIECFMVTGCTNMPFFLRGDVDNDMELTITDSVLISQVLFGQLWYENICIYAADLDLSRTVELTDAIYLNNYLFSAGPPPVGVFPNLEITECDCTLDQANGCPECVNPGDINNDGFVSIEDADILIEFLSGILSPEIPFCLEAMDVNLDGIVAINDFDLIISFLQVGDELPLPYKACWFEGVCGL